MSDFKIEIDTTILEGFATELDRLGYGRRTIFNAITKRKKSLLKSLVKIPPYNQDRYGACCVVCSHLIPTQTYNEYLAIEHDYLWAGLEGFFLLVCNKDCKEVLELNPLAYETNRVFFDDVYIKGT